jgi:predicted nucleotidyltransferase
MDCTEAISRLHAHREALFAMGIEHVAVFGSTARGEARPGSDLDLAIRLRPDVRLGWDYFTLDERVAALLGVAVDLVSEPASRTRMQAEIDRDRVDAF